MKDIIQRIDRWLQANRPNYYKNLEPGLSTQEIIEWEAKIGFVFPEDFKILYQWKNGQIDESREYFMDFSFFDPIEMVFEQWEDGNVDLVDFNNDETIAWGPSWLRIMSGFDADGYCLDVKGDLGKPGQIVYFIHDAENFIIYPDLKTMFNVMATKFEEGVYKCSEQEGKSKIEIIDEEKAKKITNRLVKWNVH